VIWIRKRSLIATACEFKKNDIMETEITIHEASYKDDFDNVGYEPTIEQDVIDENDTFGYYR